MTSASSEFRQEFCRLVSVVPRVSCLAVFLLLALPGAAPGADEAPPGPSRTAERLGVKFDPSPPAKPPELAPKSPSVVLEDPADLPLVVMPRVEVVERRGPLTPDDVLTPSGRLDLAKKRYLSPTYRAVFGPLTQLGAYYLNFLSLLGGWHPNDAEAATLRAQDRRIEMMSDVDEMIRVEAVADPKGAADLKDIRNDIDVRSR